MNNGGNTQEALHRKRRIIYNNDGCDARRPMTKKEDFLNLRTTPLAGTHVDAISYCTSECFGLFRHNTKIGTVVPVMGPKRKNLITHALIEQGTDPLEVNAEFAHENNMEVFWSMRMNWTQDARKLEMFEVNRFKKENPGCLMGRFEDRHHYKTWSAVDYAHEKVRTTATAYVEEVCCNYEIDGVELDFFRQPVLFKETRECMPVSDENRQKMTDMIRRISEIAQSEGEKRGRPIALAVRTPDDVDYAATIGLDIEQWMREGLIDISIPSGYVRLRNWRDSVEMGHKHGVQVYAGLSETRVGGGHHKHLLRASDESYRARAANAWQAGADGLYLFNLNHTGRRIWSEIGEADVLKDRDKLYFAGVRGIPKFKKGSYPYDHYIEIPTLTPNNPLPIEPQQRRNSADGPPKGPRTGKPLPLTRIEMAEDIDGIKRENYPKITLSVQIGSRDSENSETCVPAEELKVVFNGRLLKDCDFRGGKHTYTLDPKGPRKGLNTIEVCYLGQREDLQFEDAMIAVDYSGEFLSDTSYIELTRSMIGANCSG